MNDGFYKMLNEHIEGFDYANLIKEGRELYEDIRFFNELIRRQKKSSFGLAVVVSYPTNYYNLLFENYWVYRVMSEDENYCTDFVAMIWLCRELINKDTDTKPLKKLNSLMKETFDIEIKDIYGMFIASSWECELFAEKLNEIN